eukprot:6197759-Pleurochrysis_carterae.AAC.1
MLLQDKEPSMRFLGATRARPCLRPTLKITFAYLHKRTTFVHDPVVNHAFPRSRSDYPVPDREYAQQRFSCARDSWSAPMFMPLNEHV